MLQRGVQYTRENKNQNNYSLHKKFNIFSQHVTTKTRSFFPPLYISALIFRN